jgi:hypothetical protein
MNNPAPTLRDPDMLMVGVALERAALQAQRFALQTGTPCYVWKDGKIVNIGAPPKSQAATPAAI